MSKSGSGWAWIAVALIVIAFMYFTYQALVVAPGDILSGIWDATGGAFFDWVGSWF